jgi:hypothetical protein
LLFFKVVLSSSSGFRLEEEAADSAMLRLGRQPPGGPIYMLGSPFLSDVPVPILVIHAVAEAPVSELERFGSQI